MKNEKRRYFSYCHMKNSIILNSFFVLHFFIYIRADIGGTMMKGRYHPDWTWKNIWTIMRSNKRSTIVLSCRDCPNGLSPNGKFPRIVSLLSYSLGFLLAMALHDRISYLAAIIAPASGSEIIRRCIGCLIMLLSAFVIIPIIAPIIALLSFCLPIWTPAERNEKDQGKS